MSKTKMNYFKEEDILHLVISDQEEVNSVELSPNVTAELNQSGELIGIEILEASVSLLNISDVWPHIWGIFL